MLSAPITPAPSPALRLPRGLSARPRQVGRPSVGMLLTHRRAAPRYSRRTALRADSLPRLAPVGPHLQPRVQQPHRRPQVGRDEADEPSRPPRSRLRDLPPRDAFEATAPKVGSHHPRNRTTAGTPARHPAAPSSTRSAPAPSSSDLRRRLMSIELQSAPVNQPADHHTDALRLADSAGRRPVSIHPPDRRRRESDPRRRRRQLFGLPRGLSARTRQVGRPSVCFSI